MRGIEWGGGWDNFVFKIKEKVLWGGRLRGGWGLVREIMLNKKMI